MLRPTALSATYGYDDADQLLSIIYDKEATRVGDVTYSYDLAGRRIGQGGSLGSDLMLDGLGMDEIYARVSASGVTSFVSDALGSTRLLTGDDGAASASYSYSPYGLSGHIGADDTLFQFTGRENDGETGLYHYRERYYSPAIGRFIGEDPIGLFGGVNVYAYVEGDPVSSVDPTGEFGVAGAVFGAGLDLAYQMLVDGRSLKCVNWMQVGVAGALGAVGGAGAGGVFKLTKGSMKAKNALRRYHRIHEVPRTHDVHHWAISRRGSLGRHLPDSVVNHPWNLNPIERGIHRQIHNEFNPLQRWWHETPQWAKAVQGSLGGGAAAEMLDEECGC